jgi:hypothetical protein
VGTLRFAHPADLRNALLRTSAIAVMPVLH